MLPIVRDRRRTQAHAMCDSSGAVQERRISCRGSQTVARQRIHVGMVHAGRTVAVETGDTTFRVYDGDELLTEIARTTTRPIARFKVRKPEPPRRPERTQ
jgi:ribosomal 50S subunit-recycling heat shock protein